MSPVVLLIHAKKEDAALMKSHAAKEGVLVRLLDSGHYELPVGLLAGEEAFFDQVTALRKGAEDRWPAEETREPAMILAGFDEEELWSFLTVLRRQMAPLPQLKAVLTKTNASWTPIELVRELKREREALKKG